MRNGKYQNKGSKRILVLALALVLLLGCGIGGTIAWLMDSTETVTNTFTVGDINIELKEHDLKADGTLDNTTAGEVNEENTYKILPGTKQPKDPFVRVKAGSEACYVFVQVQEVNNAVDTEKYVTWSVAAGWTKLEDTDANGVTTYYREQSALTATDAQDAVHFVLAGDTDNTTGIVTYANTLTKANIEALDKDDADDEGYGTIEADEMPKLIFKAFAVQKEAGNVNAAWAAVASDAKLPD